jgi:hypothetical protein
MEEKKEKVLAQKQLEQNPEMKQDVVSMATLAPTQESVTGTVLPELGKSVSRRKRNTFNGTQTKLSVNHTIPGFHLHVFTDTGGRIQDALDNGYEFVSPVEVGGVSENVVSRNGDLGDRIRYLVNPRAEGSEQYGYLMKQRLEWYEEDQNSLQDKNNKIDNAIRKGKVTGGDPSFYVPSGGIKVQT